MRVMISYAREDRPAVDDLIRLIASFGHETWIDSGLRAGEIWWNTILARIRDCDVVLAVLSPASLTSKACNLERRYAVSLGRYVLPVRVSMFAPQSMPSELAQIHLIDYLNGTAVEAGGIFAALRDVPPRRALPQPMPPAPEPPLSYLNRVRDWLDNMPADLDGQHRLVTDLTQGMQSEDNEERVAASGYLMAFLKHSNALQGPAERASAALQRAGGPPPGGPQAPRTGAARPGRSKVGTALAWTGGVVLGLIALSIAVSALSQSGPQQPDPVPSAGVNIAQPLADQITLDYGQQAATSCPDPLPSVVGSSVTCQVTVGGQTGLATVTVVSVVGGVPSWQYQLS